MINKDEEWYDVALEETRALRQDHYGNKGCY